MTLPKSGRAILVPVKNLDRAKTRLAPLLTPGERRELALILLQGVLRGIAGIDDGGWRRIVVTSYEPAMEMAASWGFEVMRERKQHSESLSVDAASAALEGEGIRGVLRIPLDLPLFRQTSLDGMLEAVRTSSGAKQAILAPSRDGEGTNALYRSPPTLFPSRFGAGSLALHLEEARRRTREVTVLPSEELGLDIDDRADVAELLRRGQPCPALEYLQSIGIPARLQSGGDGTA